ncbi:hypothetical protein CLV40_12530 [Actinokineospora auranticolor]|uniref:Uncharacterized protein n=1 Tax=Actinokineospora auranticolor TaxID=155976 RepID=A0A2S6GEN7_9PSEU|nr:hypothetical protein CLV40_12530 [Actinokineospora auranticolor]
MSPDTGRVLLPQEDPIATGLPRAQPDPARDNASTGAGHTAPAVGLYPRPVVIAGLQRTAPHPSPTQLNKDIEQPQGEDHTSTRRESDQRVPTPGQTPHPADANAINPQHAAPRASQAGPSTSANNLRHTAPRAQSTQPNKHFDRLPRGDHASRTGRPGLQTRGPAPAINLRHTAPLTQSNKHIARSPGRDHTSATASCAGAPRPRPLTTNPHRPAPPARPAPLTNRLPREST